MTLGDPVKLSYSTQFYHLVQNFIGFELKLSSLQIITSGLPKTSVNRWLGYVFLLLPNLVTHRLLWMKQKARYERCWVFACQSGKISTNLATLGLEFFNIDANFYFIAHFGKRGCFHEAGGTGRGGGGYTQGQLIPTLMLALLACLLASSSKHD